MRPPIKIIRVGTGLGIIIPAIILRGLEIRRGDYFSMVIGDQRSIIMQRVKVVPEGELGEARDNSLPVVKNAE